MIWTISSNNFKNMNYCKIKQRVYVQLQGPTPQRLRPRASVQQNASPAPQHSCARRGVLLSLPLLTILHGTPYPRIASAASVTAEPVLDQPMRRLRLPQGTVGRDYVLVQLSVRGKGPFDFMVDTGLTAELITPHLRKALDIPPSRQRIDSGLGAGGAVQAADLVQLEGASLVGADWLPLPPLTAVVTDFLQEHMDPEHDPVEGMLGMELLEMFDVDFDFPEGRLRFFKPGDGASVAAGAGLVEVPAAVLNETGVLGIRATSPQANAGKGGRGGGGRQPFVGIIDCGASFSAMNWKAAALAGLPPKGDPAYRTSDPSRPSVAILGIDGRPQQVPTIPVQLTFVGDARRAGGDGKGGVTFASPPATWRPWAPVDAAVADLPVFSQLLGDGRTPFDGPAALIGLDVLTQRRIMRITQSGTGQHRSAPAPTP